MFAVSKVTVEAVVEASFLTVYWLIGQRAKKRTFSGEKAIERKVAVIESPTFIVVLDDAKRVPNTSYLERHQLDRLLYCQARKKSQIRCLRISEVSLVPGEAKGPAPVKSNLRLKKQL